MVPPSPDELAGGARRVELHVCESVTECSGSFRFPRYKSGHSMAWAYMVLTKHALRFIVTLLISCERVLGDAVRA